MDITTRNQIKQQMSFELSGYERKEFENIMQEFLERTSGQKIDGAINKIRVSSYTLLIDIDLEVIKEDRLKLIEQKNDS